MIHINTNFYFIEAIFYVSICAIILHKKQSFLHKSLLKVDEFNQVENYCRHLPPLQVKALTLNVFIKKLKRSQTKTETIQESFRRQL